MALAEIHRSTRTILLMADQKPYGQRPQQLGTLGQEIQEKFHSSPSQCFLGVDCKFLK